MTFSTGSRCCGKSTILQLLARLANNNNTIFGDTSEIIGNQIAQKTPTGIKLIDHKYKMGKGILLPDDLVLEAMIEWMELRSSKAKIVHYFIAGSPRSVTQSNFWKGRYQNIQVLHIKQDRMQVKAGIKARQEKTGLCREDENDEAVITAWDEYQTKIIPALNVFNGEVLHLDRKKPMRERLKLAISHLDIPDGIKKRWRNRLKTKNHPVCIEVNKLDGTN